MKTLNQIAENIAYKLGDQYNTILKNSIKDTILDYRAKFIREDLDRNFLSDVHFTQVGTLQFKVVNLLKEFGADFSMISAICPDVINQDKYNILKSTKPIPLPIRRKNAGKNPYSYIGKVDGSKKFTYVALDTFVYVYNLPYTSRTIYYTIINNYLYILNNLQECDINSTLSLCNVLIKDVFENPSDFYNACNNTGFIDDMPFPMGIDMIVNISQAIVKGEYPLKPKDGETINIKPDDNE